MVIVGIDPGKKGGIAWYYDHVKSFGHGGMAMPPTPRKIFLALQVFKSYGDMRVFIEKCHSMPKQGVASTFAFGKGIGILMGILTALEAEINEIPPQAWKKIVLAGTDKSKDAAILFVENHYPAIDLFPGKCRKAQDGIADAACLMHYGLNQ